MTAANLDAQDLGAATFGGLINEDLFQVIQDISDIPLPLSDRIGSIMSTNQFHEWLLDKLQAVDIDNAALDGADFGTDDSNLGTRVGNRHQILVKDLAVSTRARNVDAAGVSETLAYQLLMRTREIRRDLEAISLENQASVADDGAAVPGRLGGLGAWLETNTFRGALGADGGFDVSDGIVDAPTAGATRDLTETLVRDMAEAIWTEGGNPTLLMSTPPMIRGLSACMFTSSARIATLRREAGPGVTAAEAIGSVNIFLTDFEVTLEMIPNRLQQTYLSTLDVVVNVFGIDPEMLAHSWLHQWRSDPMGKPGLSTKVQISGDVTLQVNNEAAHGVIADVDPAGVVLV